MTDPAAPADTAPSPSAGSPPPGRRLPTASGPAAKAVLIGGLILLLLIPLTLVRTLIAEREARQRGVVASIGADWSGPQTLAGPILAVPYRFTRSDEDGRARTVEETAWVLPETLDLTAELAPETRRRGLFEAAVYTADIALTAALTVPDEPPPRRSDARYDWDRAKVVIGVADPRGIEPGLALRVDGTVLPTAPLDGVAVAAPASLDGVEPVAVPVGPGGVAAPVADVAPGRTLAIAATLRLKGSQALAVVPTGAETTVAAAAPWADPGFAGAFLPDRRTVDADGFTAEWHIGRYGRGFGPVIAGPIENRRAEPLAAAAFGVRLLAPVDAYRQTERMAKYGSLVVVFTYLALFLFEVVGGRRVHPIQYGLVGLALVVFYLLLLALAERLGFAPAYAIGAAAVVAQVGLYAAAVVGRAAAAVLAGLLAGLYGALWALMQLQDTALIVGAVALFAGLSAVMWATRRIDWYRAGPAGG
jgi:inner membrane protein